MNGDGNYCWLCAMKGYILKYIQTTNLTKMQGIFRKDVERTQLPNSFLISEAKVFKAF